MKIRLNKDKVMENEIEYALKRKKARPWSEVSLELIDKLEKERITKPR